MSSSPDPRPNFLVIVADDLGFSDCGCYGSEIETPSIDALAAESGSIRFTDFHVAAACSPTRSMLMTGTDHHLVGLGQLIEFARMSPQHRHAPGHEGYLNPHVVALPERLRDGGYHTMMSGKWHLGLQPEHHPVRRGFEKSFALLPGCANHYGYEPPNEDLRDKASKFFETATRALHVEDEEWVEDLPKDWYSSDGYADKLISYLSSRTEVQKRKPFFAYLPFSAPHWPLQAPKESCQKYEGLYHDGPDALRQKRLRNLKDLGLVAEGIQPHPFVNKDHQPEDWSSFEEEVRLKSARAMEVYAGMVDRMDWNIGRVVDHLKQTGEYENTLILFMSDNGAEGASYEAMPLLGDDIVAYVNKYYDNSLGNIGRADSFVWYGCRWAQAATAPSRLYKMFSTEGGCRVPLIVKPAVGTRALAGADQVRSLITDEFCTVMDIVPTFLDLADLPTIGSDDKGKALAPLLGQSWKPFLSEVYRKGSQGTKGPMIHDANHAVGFEIAGSGAVRRGDWKITFVPAPKGPQKWELFNVRDDPSEMKDQSEAQPQILKEMLALWETYKKDVGVVGLAGEFNMVEQGNRNAVPDEFDDPCAWIKYIGRPERTPERLRGVVPGVGGRPISSR